MKKKAAFLAILFLGILSGAWGQQPQTQTAPIFATNAKYVQGVGPGYWATPGSGLTLDVSAGTAYCANTIVNYAGGTLTMTVSTTNYVYLDLTSSCAVSSNTTGFTASTIPIAEVTTSGTAITSITDTRTFFKGNSNNTSGVTTTGSPASPNPACFSAASSITNCKANNIEAIRAGTTTGSANAYVLALSPAITSYTNLCVEFITNFSNTGAATLNINSVGATAITKQGISAVALASGDLGNGQIATVCYDGTQFELQSPVANAPGAGTVTTTGSPSSPLPACFSGSTSITPCKANNTEQIRIGTTTGSTNAYVLALSPAVTSYTGLCTEFISNFSNTGAATLNINSVGATAITKQGSAAVALASGDIGNTQTVTVCYDGTQFEMMSPTANAASGGGVTSFSGDTVLLNNSSSTGAVTATRATNTAPSRVYGTPPAGASSHIVQHNEGYNFSTSVSVAFGSNVTANDLLVAFGWKNSASCGTLPTLADTLSNTWINGDFIQVAGSCFVMDYTCASVSGGADTLTLNGGSGNWYSLLIIEISGNATSSCLDIHGNNSGNSSSASATGSGGVSTTDIVLGGFAQGSTSATYTAGTGQTNIDTVNGSFGITSNDNYANDILSSGTPVATSTLSASGNWGALVGAFKITSATATASFINPFINGHAEIESCGTTTTCGQTQIFTPFVLFGTVALASGSPSTATLSNLPFTSSTTYVCIPNDQTTAANGIKAVNSSGSSVVFTGPNTVSDTVGYDCIGY